MNGLINRLKNTKLSSQDNKIISEADRVLSQFTERFNWKEKSELIDRLTASDIYEIESKDSLFYWVEFKTRKAGSIFAYGGKVYPEAVKKLDFFKKLLKIVVDDTIPIDTKVDAGWNKIKGFGGDRLVAKKIIYLFNQEQLLPIFKTEHLEIIASKLDIMMEEEFEKEFAKDYDDGSIGEKFSLLNKKIKSIQEEHFSKFGSVGFVKLLYDNIELKTASNSLPRNQTSALSNKGLLYSPKYEQEVLFLFSKYHDELGFPYIKEVHVGFPDVIALDTQREEVRIELEVFSSDFDKHGHDPKKCEFIVCWKNDIGIEKENYPQIVSIEDYLNANSDD